MKDLILKNLESTRGKIKEDSTQMDHLDALILIKEAEELIEKFATIKDSQRLGVATKMMNAFIINGNIPHYSEIGDPKQKEKILSFTKLSYKIADSLIKNNK